MRRRSPCESFWIEKCKPPPQKKLIGVNHICTDMHTVLIDRFTCKHWQTDPIDFITAGFFRPRAKLRESYHFVFNVIEFIFDVLKLRSQKYSFVLSDQRRRFVAAVARFENKILRPNYEFLFWLPIPIHQRVILRTHTNTSWGHRGQ